MNTWNVETDHGANTSTTSNTQNNCSVSTEMSDLVNIYKFQ